MAEGLLRRGSWLWRTGAVAWLVMTFVLSSQSDVPSPVELPVWLPLDKFAHFVLFAVLAALLYLSGAARIWAVALAVLYGVTDEIHQMFVPGRSPEVADLLADALGAIAGSMAAARVISPAKSRGSR